MQRLIVPVALVIALLLAGCSAKPPVRSDDIEQVLFFSLQRGQKRVASPDEVRQFMAAYEAARPIPGDFGTTPPARIEVLFKSGRELVVSGGGESYSTVESHDPPLNLRGEELHRLLEQVAAGDVHF